MTKGKEKRDTKDRRATDRRKQDIPQKHERRKSNDRRILDRRK